MNPPGAGAGPAPAPAPPAAAPATAAAAGTPVFGALDHPRQLPAFFSPGFFAGTCCYHQVPIWRPAQILPACRLCLRPVLQPMGAGPLLCPIRAAASVSNSRLSRLDWHRAQQEQQQRQQSQQQLPFQGQHLFHCGRPVPPPEALSRSCFSLSQSPPRRRATLSAGEQLGQRSPGSQRASFAAHAAASSSPVKPPPQPARWIGEETKRSLPRHVYKYYLAQTREYRRQHFQVTPRRTEPAGGEPVQFGKSPLFFYSSLQRGEEFSLADARASNR